MSQKYVIVHWVDITSAPNEFSMKEWPLHVTLIANFRITQPLDVLVDQLSEYAMQTRPYTVVADGQALFGPTGNVAVTLIRPDRDILKMHTDLLSITSDLGAIYDEPVFVNDGYRPHATIQTASRLLDGQSVTVDSFTLIDMYPNNDILRRKIIRTFRLAE